MLKKIISSIIVASVLLLTVSTPLASAQWYNQSYQEWHTKVYDEANPSEIFGERYTAAQVQWVFYGFFSFILNGMSNGNAEALSCLMTREVSQCEGVLQDLNDSFPDQDSGETSSGAGNIIASFTSRPVSFIAYISDLSNRLSFVPEARAQGFGFEAANPVLNLWRVTRNISYALMTIAVLVLAFMIMFRVKISPQTVITVQSALPKVVIALILITFSYAIAGLLIDFMYVIIGLVSALFVNYNITSWSWPELYGALTQDQNILMLFLRYWDAFIFAFVVNIFFPLNFASGASIVLALLAIPTIIALLWFSIKTLWLLVKTYLQILLLIIIAPFQILLGTIAQGVGFGSWLRSMLANLAVYPFVSTMFILAFLFIRAGLPDNLFSFIENRFPFGLDSGFLGGQPWDPPLTFGTTGGSELLWVLASFGIIAIIPKTAELLKSMIEGRPFDFSTAISEPARLAAIPTSAGLETYASKHEGKLGDMASYAKEVGDYLGIFPRSRS